MADPEVDPRDESRDRLVDVSGNAPSPHNMGWYDDLIPEQRYAVIVASYLQVGAAIEDSSFDEVLSDMSIWVVGNAAHDPEAIAAGREYFKNDIEFTEKIHNAIFGVGFSSFGGFDDPDIPRIPEYAEEGEIDNYGVQMLRRLSDDPGQVRTYNYQYDLGMVGNAFMSALKGGVNEYARAMGQITSLGPEGVEVESPTKIEYPTFMQPKADDLFAASMQSAHGPEYSQGWQTAQNMAGNVPGLIVDGVILGGAAKMAIGAIGAGTTALGKAAPSGMRSWIGNALLKFKNIRGARAAARSEKPPSMSFRRKAALTNLGIAAPTTVAAYARALMNEGGLDSIPGLTPETEDMLHDVYYSKEGFIANKLRTSYGSAVKEIDTIRDEMGFS